MKEVDIDVCCSSKVVSRLQQISSKTFTTLWFKNLVRTKPLVLFNPPILFKPLFLLKPLTGTNNLLFKGLTTLAAIAFASGVHSNTFVGQSVYSNSGWNGTHGGPHNDDYTHIDLPRAFKQKWHKFRGNAFEQAIAIAGDKSTLYSANGFGANSGRSNFVALNQQGEFLWEVPAWTNTDDQYLPSADDPDRYNIGFDSCSAVNTAIIDRQGDAYISDCNQLWAFKPDGQVKWVQPLPKVPDASFCQDAEEVPFQKTSAGRVNPFVVPVFSQDGSVGGVTMYGDIVFFDRETGEKTYEDYRIQASIGCTTLPMPESTWKGIFDDELREWYYNWVFATDTFVSADTPAVAVATSGRLFVSAKSASLTTELSPGNALWAFDLIPPTVGELGKIRVAWSAPLDVTGGSSPALNIDETRVSAGTGEGYIRSFNTEDGEEVWNVYNPQAAAGSVSTSPDGIVYAVPNNGMAITANGQVLWEGAKLLNSLTDGLPEHPMLGLPMVTSSSIIELAGNKVLQSVNVGYPLAALNINGIGVVRNFIVTRDRFTGRLIPGSVPYSSHTTMENIMTPHRNGSVTLAYGSLNSSSLTAEERQRVNQSLSIIQESLLPPSGGLVQIEGVDEIYVDGHINAVITEGDLKVAPEFVAGSAKTAKARIEVKILAVEGQYKGLIEVIKPGYTLQLKVDQASIASDLGPHAAEGVSDAFIILHDSNYLPAARRLRPVHWIIKDWSENNETLSLAETPLSSATESFLMEHEAFQPHDLTRLTRVLNLSRSVNRAPCVYLRRELPVYELAPNDFSVIASYTTKCHGTHSISVNTQVSGRGWLVAYVFKRINGEWKQVNGGLSTASYYGGPGEYRLVTLNRDNNIPATGRAKFSYPMY